MAAVDEYADAQREAGNVTNPAKTYGAQVICACSVASVAAADDNNSIYRMLSNVPGEWIPVHFVVKNDAITGGSDYNLGLFKPNYGAVIDDNCFADALDMSSASVTKDGLGNVAITDWGKKIYEHAGHTVTTKIAAYDIGFTGITNGSGAGTIVLIAFFVQG